MTETPKSSYCVDVIETATGEVVNTVGPVSSYAAADKVERGMRINMSSRFSTIIRWQDVAVTEAK